MSPRRERQKRNSFRTTAQSSSFIRIGLMRARPGGHEAHRRTALMDVHGCCLPARPCRGERARERSRDFTIRPCRKATVPNLERRRRVLVFSSLDSLLTQTLASVHHCRCQPGRLDGGFLEQQSGPYLGDAAPLANAHREKSGTRQSRPALRVDTQSLSVQQVIEHSAPSPHLQDAGLSAVQTLQARMIVVVHAGPGRSGRLHCCF